MRAHKRERDDYSDGKERKAGRGTGRKRKKGEAGIR